MPTHAATALRSSPESGGLSWTLRFAAAALLLPQLPTLIWCLETRSLIYMRGWVNLEYLMALALVIMSPSWITLIIATLEMCLALVEPIAHLYYFHPGDVLSSLQYLILVPVPRLLEYGFLLSVYAAITLIALRLLLGLRSLRWAKQMVCFIMVFGLLATLADVVSGRFAHYFGFGSSWADADVGAPRIISMPIASLVYPLYHFSRADKAVQSSSVPLASALAQAMAELPVGSLPDVVLVLTESWGLAKDRRITQAQMEPYRLPSVTKLYRIQTGQVRFDGSTTSGETRELCGNSAGHASLGYPDSYFAGCWPHKLNREGYSTLTVHGFTPSMFRRGEWYHRFGFDRDIFQSDLQREGAAMCGGAFPGICDEDVALWIEKSLLASRNQRPRFIHWVTLNSHLPVPAISGASSEQRCVATGMEHEQALCSWFLLVRRVNESVVRLAEAPGLRPTVFVIVGDHAPPFIRPNLREQFSQTDVPYVILLPQSFRSRTTAGAYPPTPRLH